MCRSVGSGEASECGARVVSRDDPVVCRRINSKEDLNGYNQSSGFDGVSYNGRRVAKLWAVTHSDGELLAAGVAGLQSDCRRRVDR